MSLYEYPSNFSNGTSVNSLGSLLNYANYTIEGWFAYGWLLIIFLFSYVMGMLISSRKALLASSFVTFIFSIYFMRLGMVNLVIVFALLLLVIVSAIGGKEETI